MRYYRVAAENGATPARGPYSASASAMTRPTGVPVTSTDLAGVAVGTQTVELTWTAPAGTIAGYKIDRSTNGGTTWVVANADTGNDNAYYSDTHSSLAGKSVVYRIAAMNSAGMGVYSANSALCDASEGRYAAGYADRTDGDAEWRGPSYYLLERSEFAGRRRYRRIRRSAVGKRRTALDECIYPAVGNCHEHDRYSCSGDYVVLPGSGD